MKALIRTHLDQPAQLEQLYRNDKNGFKQAFNSLYPDIREHIIAQYWHERLNFTGTASAWGTRQDLVFVLIAAAIAGCITKFPAIFGFNEEFFYSRNIGFIIFPPLTAYFAWKNNLSPAKIAGMFTLMLAGLVFINLLPDDQKSNTLILSCMHLMLVLWAVLAFSFTGKSDHPATQRLGFLKYNGDVVVMGALILIAGGLMSAVTVGLFGVIGFKIEEFYFRNIVPVGLAAVPIVATWLTRVNPQLVGKVSPVIAKLFSPLVLIMLVIYLGAMIYSGKDPYNDRDFLMVFNALLIGVMAIIFFSITETAKQSQKSWEVWNLFFLAMVTIIVNGIALSAIIFRIAEWGMTPNRAAVLGSNALMLVNLLLVGWKFFRVLNQKEETDSIGKLIALYLPVYMLWAFFVTFLFPVIFGYK